MANYTDEEKLLAKKYGALTGTIPPGFIDMLRTLRRRPMRDLIIHYLLNFTED